ncbi:MAG: DNA polymerase III subunit delta [Neisseriaceae bacterium]|nr:MAG: DNA polymerase III subunit delta [Neisseriaceae bacterium]
MKPLYVIYGEEDLFRFESLDTIRKKAKAEGYLHREVFRVETNFNWNELWYALESQELFSEKKLLEIHIANGKPGKLGSEQLQFLVDKIQQMEDISVVIFLPKIDRTQIQSKWFKKMAEIADLHEAKTIYPSQLPSWILGRLARYNLKIDKHALMLFSERIEGNLLAANQEIEKMALLHKPGDLIGLDEIQSVIANVARFDIFQISEAWMSGDIVRVLKLLEVLELNGAEPVLMIWVISEDIRTLIRLCGALKQGKTIASVKNSLKLWGNKQYVAQKAIQRISIRRLIWALQECSSIDRQIKGVETGNIWYSVKSLLIDLSK